jgi:transposase InsO family protein
MDHQLPVAVVCRVLGAPRSTVYARRQSKVPTRPGPVTSISDDDLVQLIGLVLVASPFAGEGYRKVRARLRREHGVQVSGKRVLRLLRRAGLLAPQRVRGRRKPRPHDGTIIPAAPNVRWGTDATMAWTRVDGWVWVFVCVDHYTAEAWAHVAKVGDRFAALQPIYDAVIDRWGRLDADVARGLELRHDWGPQYRSAHFTGSLAWLGIADSPAFLGEPETNGCAERWIRTSRTSACGSSSTTPPMSSARPWPASWSVTTAPGSSNATATELQRRPTRQHNQQQRHDRTDHESVQGTGCCSPGTGRPEPCLPARRLPGQAPSVGWPARPHRPKIQPSHRTGRPHPGRWPDRAAPAPTG